MARNLPAVAAPPVDTFTAAIDLTPLQLSAAASLMIGFRGAQHADQWAIWFSQDSTLAPTPGSTAGLARAPVLPALLAGTGPFVLPFTSDSPALGTQCYVEHVAGPTVGPGVILISGSPDPFAGLPSPVVASFTTDGAGNINVDPGAAGVSGVTFSGTNVSVTFASPMPSASYVIQGSFYSDVDDSDAHRGFLTPIHGGRTTGGVILKLSEGANPTALALRIMVLAIAS